MSVPVPLRVLNQGEEGTSLALEQLHSLKNAMASALENRDWHGIMRLDRLCAQILTAPECESSSPEALQLLFGIKALYRQMLLGLNQELSAAKCKAL